MDVQAIEKALVTQNWEPSIPENPVSNIAKAVVRGRFGEALKSSYAQQLFAFRPADTLKDSFDFSASLTQDEQEDELLHLVFAVACLNAFLQVNWTGPDLDFEPFDILSHPEPRDYSRDSLNQLSIAELALGGEPAYHLTKYALFLRLAQLLLNIPYKHCNTIIWWQLRTHLAHQQVIDEPVFLFDDITVALERWQNPFASDSPDLAGRLLLEHGLLHHTLRQDKVAAEYFVKAARATDLQYELTGALGKRTKFQQTELSQLVLLAESRLPDEGSETKVVSSVDENSQPIVPETLVLNDDTLLEQTEFTSSKSSSSTLRHIDPSEQPPLHPLDQCILLSLCLNVRNTSPSHGLTLEQMTPYVSRVITHPRNWTIHTMALLIRSRLEANRTRTAERSALQLQALVDQIPATDAEAAPVSERLRYIHSISLPPKWELERELASRFISLGVIKSALDIYERLEMWEEVVKCHVSLERPDRGIAIVKDLLSGNKIESEAVTSREKASGATTRLQRFDSAREAKLWCILGDLDPEHAVEHYKHAWELSKNTSGRAMRSLGGYHFARAEYEPARECLQTAVKIEPLLSRSWFILGCACMRLEDWLGAKNAFARCVTIDEEDGESWSNLASMYLRIEQSKKDESLADTTPVTHSNKQLAFRALKEGLKRSYDNWRMWSNYMIIAVDIGELAEACRALGRVIEETTNKPDGVMLDEDVLDRLVNAVTHVPFDSQEAREASSAPSDQAQLALNPNEGHGLLPRVLDLMDRVVLPRVSSVRVFRAYARLMTWMGRWEDSMKAWMDAYRESDAGKLARGEIDTLDDAGRGIWRDAVAEVEEIVDILKNIGVRLEASGSTKKWRLQAKSIVRTFMGRTRENFEDDPEWHRLEILLEDMKQE
ncbi:tetratricopeptide repeat domain 27 [Lentinula raphanica]|nr:tetratricopeptide repeat domain 27 [Lentinula raphanica]